MRRLNTANPPYWRSRQALRVTRHLPPTVAREDPMHVGVSLPRNWDATGLRAARPRLSRTRRSPSTATGACPESLRSEQLQALGRLYQSGGISESW